MKFYPEKKYNLDNELNKILKDIRLIRGFHLDNYLKAKLNIIKDYFEKSKLDTAVIAISGGIDSAVALAIISYVQKNTSNLIKKIIPITLPLLNQNGATNQFESIKKAEELCQHFKLKLYTYKIDNVVNNIKSTTKILGNSNHWAEGQLTAYARTPFLYYSTSILSSQKNNPVIIGTTNRDEGAYLGFVGKASDGMVDIQIISDLHKSEVYKLARYFKIPNSILSSAPNGDMYDNRTDEEVFGASYDFVELYLNYINLPLNIQNKFLKNIPNHSLNLFNSLKKNIENLHNYNSHKYLIGSQAIHLDVMESAVKNGWIDGIHSGRYKNEKNEKLIFTDKFTGFTDKFTGFTDKILDLDLQFKSNIIINKNYKIPTLIKTEGFLNNFEIKKIFKFFKENKHKLIKTDKYGMKNNLNKTHGSERISFYDPCFAKNLLILMKHLNLVDVIKFKNSEHEYSNYGNSTTFKIKEINPMFRILKYKKDSELIAHYDDTFLKDLHNRSLTTVLIGIKEAESGGETEFILTPQDHICYKERNFNDRDVLLDNIDESIKISGGDLILFDHRLLHQSKKVLSGYKLVIRTEIIYESCD